MASKPAHGHAPAPVSYRQHELYDEAVTDELAAGTLRSLELIGEDPAREGLVKTPERAAKALQFMTKGYAEDADEILRSALFTEDYSEMVLVKHIEFYSLCEHHMLPFYGRAHVAYIPAGRIVGLSKIPRVIDVYARRLQVQERLTWQILQCLDRVLQPQGAAVILEARHMCMMMRGAQKQASVTTTSAFSGQFEHPTTRTEFLQLVASDIH